MFAWIKQVYSILEKDIRSEFRQKYAISGILMFAFVVVIAVSFALSGIKPGPRFGAILFWITVLFADLAGFAHSFIKEEEEQTALALKLCTEPAVIFWGKMLFNVFLATVLLITIIPLSIIFLGLVTDHWLDFILFAFFASLAMTVGTTLIAAITAKASGRGPLFTILSFPVLLPVLIVAIKATYAILSGNTLLEQLNELITVISYIMLMGAIGHLLFEQVWQDASK